MQSPLSLLRKHGIRPRKRLGQNFLCDPNILEKIVRIAGVRDTDTVVEIGSGIGVLTALLAARARRVIALEVDRRLVEVLRSELGGLSNVAIVHGDVLEYDFASARAEGGKGRVRVVGNVPYNLSSPIVLRLLDYRESVDRAVLMLQREVADRLAAAPGTKDYGPLSVTVSLYTEARLEMRVPASCFVPRPDVESRVIRLDMRREPLCGVDDPALFRDVVRSCFARRRKTLLNNLRQSSLPVRPEAVPAVLEELGIDGTRRAETLTVLEFAALSNRIGRGQNP
ncbi:MAG: Ribosomal RNA small subunit methyltransferase A [Syntrophaceae bacterium PtaB.Bin038]|nr:MAG: Ribosomal RNA small subunit methyltransferase A [Syntrophaceae bacterium PtaB.Bin038]